MKPKIAIVDYGLGNLFSVKHACACAGMDAAITSSRDDILAADGLILPGIGAYRDAMAALQRLDLAPVLRDVASSGKPVVGICLGLQLFMTESYEFGRYRGLNIIEGEVLPLRNVVDSRLKVPHVGWNGISPTGGELSKRWSGGLLDAVPKGAFMYFVHSFFPKPADPNDVLSLTKYGPLEFCSAVCRGNVFGFQFHPERSGPNGLAIYAKLSELISGGEC